MLLLEAGGQADLPEIAVPPDWLKLSGSAVDWRYVTTGQADLGGRVVPYPRGKVLGGSSSINALAYQHGHASGYDRWVAAGCPGWGFLDLLPYFRRAETFSGGASTPAPEPNNSSPVRRRSNPDSRGSRLPHRYRPDAASVRSIRIERDAASVAG